MTKDQEKFYMRLTGLVLAGLFILSVLIHIKPIIKECNFIESLPRGDFK